jgi:hypothetical protein
VAVTEEDVPLLTPRLKSYAHEWKEIGVTLGFWHDELENIIQRWRNGWEKSYTIAPSTREKLNAVWNLVMPIPVMRQGVSATLPSNKMGKMGSQDLMSD